MLAGAEGDLLARCNLNRDTVLLALLGVAGNQRFTLGQIGGEAVMPCRSAEGAQQSQRGGFDLIDRAVSSTKCNRAEFQGDSRVFTVTT